MLWILCLAAPLHAAVSGMEVIKREDVAGRYERIRAKAHFTLDPSYPPTNSSATSNSPR